MLKNIFQSHPNSELTICYAEDSYLVVGMPIILDHLKFDRNLCQNCLRLGTFGGLSWPKFAKLTYWGNQKCLFRGSKMQIFAILFVLQMSPNDFGGTPRTTIMIFGEPKLTIFWVKNAQMCTKLICSKWPQKSFGRLTCPKLAKLAYLGVKNAQI